jgi:hypothetical protein
LSLYRTNITNFSVSYQAPKFFNSLSDDIRSAPSITSFFSKLKSFLFTLWSWHWRTWLVLFFVIGYFFYFCSMTYMACNFHIALNFVSSWAMNGGDRTGGRKSRGKFVKYDKYRVFPTSIFITCTHARFRPRLSSRKCKEKYNYWLFAETLHNWAP